MEVETRLEIIRRLCAFEGRLTGTDSERRAAGFLAGVLERGGRRPELEPVYVHPQYALVEALHVTLAIAGSVVAAYRPPIGFAIALFATASLYWDLHTRFYLLRRLFFRRLSQNVVAPGVRPEAPATLILCAHYDAARGGAVFNRRSLARIARLGRRLRIPLGPFRLIFWTMASLLPLLGARLAGVEGEWLSIVQLVPTMILVVALFGLVDIALSPVVPGASDNASGVATAISLAAELDRLPPANLDVWVLLTAGEECLSEGMRGFLRAHRDRLGRGSTTFINLDTAGAGTVRYQRSEGFVFSLDMNARLVELCEAVASADRAGANSYGARPRRDGGATDAVPARLAGFAAITLRCLDELDLAPGYHTLEDAPDRIETEALERIHGFALELIRALDTDVGRRAATAEPASA